ncbi:MAG: hypothetical protein JWM34_1583 [Ilumatobacteraceae bacterium]|nr:hypothetical protein [Ilumatobacteraceae bacterium]
MKFEDKCREWYRALPDELRAEARDTVGVIPEWMVVSLQRAEIPVVPCEIADGHTDHGYLMPAALILFLAALSQDPPQPAS